MLAYVSLAAAALEPTVPQNCVRLAVACGFAVRPDSYRGGLAVRAAGNLQHAAPGQVLLWTAFPLHGGRPPAASAASPDLLA